MLSTSHILASVYANNLDLWMPVVYLSCRFNRNQVPIVDGHLVLTSDNVICGHMQLDLRKFKSGSWTELRKVFLPQPGLRTSREAFNHPKLTDRGFELLCGLLRHDPRQRLTAAQALNDPWCAIACYAPPPSATFIPEI
jgi:hypothetical protein